MWTIQAFDKSDDFNEIKMEDNLPVSQPGSLDRTESDDQTVSDEVIKLQTDFQSRLVAANLRTEAVRAGMIDLDGLKLVDLSDVRLDHADKIVGGRQIMAELRRSKPWLFGATSSSSLVAAPASQPVRQKTAMDMTDEEYASARTAVTNYEF
jgi:hypothetical protein